MENFVFRTGDLGSMADQAIYMLNERNPNFWGHGVEMNSRNNLYPLAKLGFMMLLSMRSKNKKDDEENAKVLHFLDYLSDI